MIIDRNLFTTANLSIAKVAISMKIILATFTKLSPKLETVTTYSTNTDVGLILSINHDPMGLI
jgi:hypothetical protein